MSGEKEVTGYNMDFLTSRSCPFRPLDPHQRRDAGLPRILFIKQPASLRQFPVVLVLRVSHCGVSQRIADGSLPLLVVGSPLPPLPAAHCGPYTGLEAKGAGFNSPAWPPFVPVPPR